MSAVVGDDAAARGDLAEELVPEAVDLAMAVREESREEIAARVGGLSRHRLEALVVVLAAMVDPDRSVQDALGWLEERELVEEARAAVAAGGVDVREFGACVSVDPRVFEEGREEEAKAVCRRCPVRAECLAVGLRSGGRGVWGGLTEGERRVYRRGRGAPQVAA